MFDLRLSALALVVICSLALPRVARAEGSPSRPTPAALGYGIRLDTALEGIHKDFCWFHPRVGAMPGLGRSGKPAVVMTLQKHLHISDFYSGLFSMRTDDLGTTWTKPVPRPELDWRTAPGGVTLGVCDCTPGWHEQTGKLIVIGVTVRYIKGHLIPNQPAETVYSVHDPQAGTWTPWREIKMPNRDRFYYYRAGCSQWLNQPDGSLLIPVYYKAKSVGDGGCCSVTVLQCSFDGDTIRYVKHGTELHLNVPRGLDEPSITFFGGKYYLTLRNDVRGYATYGADGLTYAPIRPWTFDDGKELGSYNTQQHWVTHSDGLFLAYTRRGADNDHIIRSRAPLFIGQVDPDRLCVIRRTERVLIPERGATLGNFGAAAVSERESWVTVGEGMFGPAAQRGAKGAVFVARILWSKPNKLIQRLR